MQVLSANLQNRKRPVFHSGTAGITPASYTATARVLHWIVAVLVISTFAMGWGMQSLPKGPGGIRADVFNFHKSIGITLLILMAARLLWRLAHPAPRLPLSMPLWQRRAALLNHALLYSALFAMPLAGYLGSAWSGYPIRYFGMTLPAWAAKSIALKDLCSTIHLWSSWVLCGTLTIHIAAALKHRWVDRDGVFERMLGSATKLNRTR